MNDIAILQNLEPQLDLRRAARYTYDREQEVMMAQFLIATVALAVGSVLGLRYPMARPYVALFGFLVVLLDIFGLDRWQKRLNRLATKFAAAFDCVVLGLSWDSPALGECASTEDIVAAVTAFHKKYAGAAAPDIYNWYMNIDADMSVERARFICQPQSLWYDGVLRKAHVTIVLAIPFAVIVVLLAYALIHNLRMTDICLLLLPSGIFMGWSLRGITSQRDVIAAQIEQIKCLDKAMQSERNGIISTPDCLTTSMAIQSSVFLRKGGTRQIFPFIYDWKRAQMHNQATAAALNVSP